MIQTLIIILIVPHSKVAGGQWSVITLPTGILNFFSELKKKYSLRKYVLNFNFYV